VALVLEQFDEQRGGLEQWAFEFAAGLMRRGHDVHVVANRFAENALATGIVPHRLEGAASRLGFARAAEQKLRTLAVDVIHDLGAGWYCDVLQPHGGSWAAVYEHKLQLRPRWLRPIKRRVDRLLPRQRAFRALTARQVAADGRLVVALSQAEADDFHRLHGVAPSRIRVVYNGVDTERFSPRHRAEFRDTIRRRLAVSPQTCLTLIAAHNFRLKGVATLLRTMKRLIGAKPPVHLAVVGGRRLNAWRRRARRLGVASNVTFVGTIDDVAPYYAAADFYVHPTFYDTCSLVALEAAACGLPVITTRQNGAAELFSDGVDGLLMNDPGDALDLAEKMRQLLDGTLRQTMGNAARRMALQHTFDRNVEEMLAVYREVGARGRLRPSHRQRQRVG